MADIAIVCGAGIVSGKEIMALELGQGLREAGLAVHFVTSRWGSGEFGRRAEAASFSTDRMWLGYISATRRVSEIRMTLDQMRRWPELVIAYLRFLRAFRPDKVIHTNWHHALLLLPFLKARRDIYWVHELMPDKRQYRSLFRRLAARIGCFVAVSDAAAKALVRIGVPQEKVRTVRNGLADPASASPKTSTAVEAVGIVGQIGAWKGHENLLDAFSLVARQYPDMQVRIFGRGSAEYEQLLRNRAKRLGIDDKVHWMGFVGERKAIYGDLTILAVPSRSEDPLPTSAIEAAFFGIPVVASRRGGLPEIVEDGVTGFLFEAGDVSGLAKRMIDLLENSSLRQEMGRHARERARMVFSRDRFMREFSALLK